MLKFINANIQLILNSSHSTHAKDLMMFDDFVSDYYTTKYVFHPICHITADNK